MLKVTKTKSSCSGKVAEDAGTEELWSILRHRDEERIKHYEISFLKVIEVGFLAILDLIPSQIAR